MGLIIANAKKKGFCFKLGNTQLSSKYDPQTEGERVLENFQAKIKKNTTSPYEQVLVFLGYFPVYHILETVTNYPHLKILIFENFNLTNTDLHTAWDTCSVEESIKNNFYKLNFFIDLSQLVKEISDLSKEVLQNLIIIPSPYIEPPLVTEFQQQYLELFRKKVSEANTISHFQYLWEIHTICNLKYLSAYKGNLIRGLKWEYNDLHFTNGLELKKPALFISSGPLLDEYLEKHSENLDKIISISKIIPVIAVPSIARRLSDLGVSLTAVFTSDAGFANSYHFMHLTGNNTIPTITPLSVHPSILRNSKEVFCYCDLEINDEKIINILDKANFISPDASVVLSGIRFFAAMGFKNIFTLGIDFVMYPFKEHAISNTSEELWFSRTNRWKNYTTLTHKTYHFEEIGTDSFETNRHLTTNPVLEIYKNAFQKLKSNLAARHISVQNADSILRLTLRAVNHDQSKRKKKLTYQPNDINYLAPYKLIKNYLSDKPIYTTEPTSISICEEAKKNTIPSTQATWISKRFTRL